MPSPASRSLDADKPLAHAISRSTPRLPDSSTTPELARPTAREKRRRRRQSRRAPRVDCPAEELRPTLTGKQRLAPEQPTTFQLSIDQRLGPDLHRAGDQEELRVEDLFRQRPDLEHRGLSVRDQADQPELASEHAVAWSLTWERQALQVQLQVGSRQAPDARTLHRNCAVGGCRARAAAHALENSAACRVDGELARACVPCTPTRPAGQGRPESPGHGSHRPPRLPAGRCYWRRREPGGCRSARSGGLRDRKAGG